MTDGGRGRDLETILEMSEWTLTNPGEVTITERTNRAGRDAHPGGRLANEGRRGRLLSLTLAIAH